MLRSTIASGEKVGEKYSVINVTKKLEKVLLSVLPASVVSSDSTTFYQNSVAQTESSFCEVPL